MEYEYDNIICLAKKHNFKKIMIMRNSWNYGNWGIVNKVLIKPENKFGFAFGHTHYANGNTENGQIGCAGNFAWRVIKVLDEDMEVVYLSDKE